MVSLRSLGRAIERAFERHPVAAPAVTAGALLVAGRVVSPSGTGKAIAAIDALAVGMLGFTALRGVQALAERRLEGAGSR